jgi:hypothetical protein
MRRRKKVAILYYSACTYQHTELNWKKSISHCQLILKQDDRPYLERSGHHVASIVQFVLII